VKLSKQTINILRNFSGINTNLLITPGNKLMTVAANKTGFAMAEVDEKFPVQFGLYDLGELLGVLSIFTDPELEFSEKSLTISEGKNRIRYMPADTDVLIYPKKEPKFTDTPEATFELTAQHLGQIIKAASVLKVPIVTIKGDGSKIVILVHDKTNPNSNQFAIDVEADTQETFDMHVKVDSLKMLPETYQVHVSFNKILKFVGERKTYLVTCETDSSSE
jgi:gp45 sliding clamp, C terminal